jgi:hypothetical protein
MLTAARLAPAAAAGAAIVATAAPAQVMTQRSVATVSFRLELEPHFTVGAALPPGPGTGSGSGLGVRGSYMVAPQGFIDAVEDSISFGVGLDIVRYRGDGGLFGRCLARPPAPAGTSVCTEVDIGGAPHTYIFVPVVLQWSFWLTPRWSLFGEPGITIFAASGEASASPALFVDGRFQLTNTVALTLRLGWPTISLGASFLMP